MFQKFSRRLIPAVAGECGVGLVARGVHLGDRRGTINIRYTAWVYHDSMRPRAAGGLPVPLNHS